MNYYVKPETSDTPLTLVQLNELVTTLMGKLDAYVGSGSINRDMIGQYEELNQQIMLAAGFQVVNWSDECSQYTPGARWVGGSEYYEIYAAAILPTEPMRLQLAKHMAEHEGEEWDGKPYDEASWREMHEFGFDPLGSIDDALELITMALPEDSDVEYGVRVSRTGSGGKYDVVTRIQTHDMPAGFGEVRIADTYQHGNEMLPAALCIAALMIVSARRMMAN